MLRRQGIRRSYCSTVAIPPFVMVIVTGLVLPSVAATSAPELDNSTMRWRQRPPEPPPLRRRYHPSLWRGFSFDLDLTRLLEYLGKYLERLGLLFVLLVAARHRIELVVRESA